MRWCDYSKIYHITLIVCAPYFVNLNNNTFQLKTLLLLVHLRSQQKRTELECGPMPNVMVALPNIGGALFNAAKFGRRPLLDAVQ